MYWLYGEDGAILYIGASMNPRARLAVHKSSKPWWHLVRRSEIEWFPDRPQARAVETRELRKHRPPYQVIPEADGRHITRAGGKRQTGPNPVRSMRIPQAAIDEARAVAKERGESLAAVVNAFLIRYVARHRARM